MYFEKGCDLKDGEGSADACLSLGVMHRYGEGQLDQDLATAIEYYQQGCDLGNAWSCSNVGSNLRSDKPHQDFARAAEVLAKACDMDRSRGAGRACYHLARMRDEGEGAFRNDPRRASELHMKSCELEYEWACFNASVTLEGLGDLAGAKTMASRGCDLERGEDSGDSCAQLGRYQADEGARADAYRSFSKGCALGSLYSCEWLFDQEEGSERFSGTDLADMATSFMEGLSNFDSSSCADLDEEAPLCHLHPNQLFEPFKRHCRQRVCTTRQLMETTGQARSQAYDRCHPARNPDHSPNQQARC